MFCVRCGSIVPLGVIVFAYAVPLSAQNLEKFAEEQMRDFLLNAKVVNSRQIGKGITSPYRLTLSDGTLVHDAEFQSINVYEAHRVGAALVDLSAMHD
jgi:hypothetical protein